MKIFGICLIKNEIDIIEYCLHEQSKWADKIFVYDNGSNDGTWELVQELSKNNPVIIPWKSENKPYHDGLRAEVFQAFKSELSRDDWWAIIDADEFFILNPRSFLKKVPFYCNLVKTKSYEYLVTIEDSIEFSYDNHFPEDLDKMLYYKPQVYSECRFMRHRPGIKWIPEERRKWPKHAGIIFSEPIPLKHYQYRSPEHIQKRLKIRKQATIEGYKHFKRDNVEEWKDKLLPRSKCNKETQEMNYGFFNDLNTLPVHYRVFYFIAQTLRIIP
jgi:glycosyltransferase involved in cell wall biosynthesis